MDQQKLQQILDDHKLWLESGSNQGKRADLQGTDLQGANLQETDLQEAGLRRADLRGAYLWRADLRGADLHKANLLGANSPGADLCEADLRGAILRGAILQGADLRKADLRGADLQGADLRGVDLQEAYLREANFREAELWGVKLEGAKYNPEQLLMARNVPPEYLSDAKPTSTDVYQRRAEDAQSKVTALEREKRELEAKLKAAEQGSAQSESFKQGLEAAENELSQVRSQLEQNQQKQEALDELAGAIEPIMEAVESDKETVKAYKRQSRQLLISGLTCFALTTVFILGKTIFSWQLPLTMYPISSAQLLLQIAPGFVFAILGTALLRHDWKIRQLTLKLIDQNNSVDIAMGMLTTALRLSNIGEKKDIEGIPDLVKDSFAEVRRALLYRNRSDATASADDGGKDAGSLRRIEDMLARQLGSNSS